MSDLPWESPEQQQNQQSKPYIFPNAIRCPYCKRRENIAFVTEYHKATICKIFSSLILIIICIIIGDIVFAFFHSPTNTKITSIMLCLALSFVLFWLKIIEHIIESKTHVQAICKDCGHIWLLN